MSLRTRAVVLAITIGLTALPAIQAAQAAKGLTQNGSSANGLATNGLTQNGNDVRSDRHDASLSKIRLKTVILQDGSTIDLR
jgi:hypothetical protein